MIDICKKWSLHYSSSYHIVILHSLLQGKIFYEVWFHFFLFVVHAFDIRSKNFFTLNVYEVYTFSISQDKLWKTHCHHNKKLLNDFLSCYHFLNKWSNLSSWNDSARCLLSYWTTKCYSIVYLFRLIMIKFKSWVGWIASSFN